MARSLEAQVLLDLKNFNKNIGQVVNQLQAVQKQAQALGATGGAAFSQLSSSIRQYASSVRQANQIAQQSLTQLNASATRTASQFGQITQQATRATGATKNIGVAAKDTLGPLESMSSFFGRIATFTVAAGLIVRGFFAITDAIKQMVAEGINFNAQLEQGRFAIASLLTATRDIADEQGKNLSVAESYSRVLAEADKIQLDILKANISTLGTGEELLNVYEQVLASTAGQKRTLEDV